MFCISYTGFECETSVPVAHCSTMLSTYVAPCTGKTPCKYRPVFALYLYRIESNHVNTVQKWVRIYTAFFL